MSDPIAEAEVALREAERWITTAKCALRDAREQRERHLTHQCAPRPEPVPMCAEAMDDLDEEEE